MATRANHSHKALFVHIHPTTTNLSIKTSNQMQNISLR